MLNNFRASAVLVASDLERAKAFYQDILGLTPLQGPPGIAIFGAGSGSQVVIYQKEGGPQAKTTVLGFEVEGLEHLLKDLKAKGVEQDLTDLPEGTDANGIAHFGPVASTWIKDSEGNVIALNEMAG